jgi:hypothetical protein
MQYVSSGRLSGDVAASHARAIKSATSRKNLRSAQLSQSHDGRLDAEKGLETLHLYQEESLKLAESIGGGAR